MPEFISRAGRMPVGRSVGVRSRGQRCAAPEDDGNAAHAAFRHPLGERRIHVVGMTGKPARELAGQGPACGGMTAAGKEFAHLGHGFQHRLVFVDMALRRREGTAEHPFALLAEMALSMLGHGVEVMRQLGIGRCQQGVEEVDELAVGGIHRAVAKQELVGPGEVLLR
jgi:hypothetical protein